MDTTNKPSNTSSPSANRKTMKGAEIMVDYLIKEKVPYLFGVCGHGNIGFLDAAAGAADRIKTISVHHEQAAGYMADAYYKVKHQPVATYTSCGPGSCNMPVALAGAMMDSSSFLAITGNVPTTQFNRMPFQETGRYFQGDFPSVIRPLVKKSFQPTRSTSTCRLMYFRNPLKLKCRIPIRWSCSARPEIWAPSIRHWICCLPQSARPFSSARAA